MLPLGTVIRLPDGRIGTVVYNGPDGVGIVVVPDECRHLLPHAMLRSAPSNDGLECVGDEYAVMRMGVAR